MINTWQTYVNLELFETVNELVFFGYIVLLLYQRVEQAQNMEDSLILKIWIYVKLNISWICLCCYLVLMLKRMVIKIVNSTYFDDCEHRVVISLNLELTNTHFRLVNCNQNHWAYEAGLVRELYLLLSVINEWWYVRKYVR